MVPLLYLTMEQCDNLHNWLKQYLFQQDLHDLINTPIPEPEQLPETEEELIDPSNWDLLLD